MTYAANLIGLTLIGFLVASSPVAAQPGACRTSPGWQAGNNSDEGDPQIGDLGDDGMTLLEFTGPDVDAGRPAGYTTFAAPIEGLVTGARYRLHLVFQRRRDSIGIAREVSLSVASLQPQAPVVFRHPRRQTFQRNYIAGGNRAVIMIHMRGYNKMWSYAGLPRLCRV